jgi:hypothetical protein
MNGTNVSKKEAQHVLTLNVSSASGDKVNTTGTRYNILAMAMRTPKMIGQVPRSRCSLQHLNMMFPIAIMQEIKRIQMPMANMTCEATCHPASQGVNTQ